MPPPPRTRPYRQQLPDDDRQYLRQQLDLDDLHRHPVRSRRTVGLWLAIGGLIWLGGCAAVVRAVADDDPDSQPMIVGDIVVEDERAVDDPGAPTTAIAESTRTGSVAVGTGILESNGNRWEVTATAPRDITDEVLAANQYNQSPPEGSAFVGTDITFTLLSSEEGSVSPLADWTAMYQGSTQVFDETSCGVVPNGLDVSAEVEPGGSVSGTYCIVVPLAEVGGLSVILEPLFVGEPQVITP